MLITNCELQNNVLCFGFKKDFVYTSVLHNKLSLDQSLMKYDEQYESPFMKMMSHLQLMCRAASTWGQGGYPATQILGGVRNDRIKTFFFKILWNAIIKTCPHQIFKPFYGLAVYWRRHYTSMLFAYQSLRKVWKSGGPIVMWRA